MLRIVERISIAIAGCVAIVLLAATSAYAVAPLHDCVGDQASPWIRSAGGSGQGADFAVSLAPSQLARTVGRYAIPYIWDDLHRCVTFPPLTHDQSQTLYNQLDCHARFALTTSDYTGGPTWDLEAWRPNEPATIFNTCDPGGKTRPTSFPEPGVPVPSSTPPVSTLPEPSFQPLPPLQPVASGSSRVTLSQGPAAPSGYRYAISLSGFAAGTEVPVKCYDSVSRGGFYPFSLKTDASGNASTASYCYSGDGPDHWVIAGGVESNHVMWSAPVPQPAPTWSEQETPNHPVNTFTNYHNASGMGPAIAAGQWVAVSCKVYDPFIASVNPDGYWYRIASAPWSNAYYSPANTFMNGDPYGGPYSHNTDFSVPNC